MGEPVELVFALAPTSNIFDRGHRIRVTVTCTDYADKFDTPREPGAEVTMYRSQTHASYISLPLAQRCGTAVGAVVVSSRRRALPQTGAPGGCAWTGTR